MKLYIFYLSILLTVWSCKKDSKKETAEVSQSDGAPSTESLMLAFAPIAGQLLQVSDIEAEEIHEGTIGTIKVVVTGDKNTNYIRLWICEKDNPSHCTPGSDKALIRSSGEFMVYEIPSKSMTITAQACANSINAISPETPCGKETSIDFVSSVMPLNDPKSTETLAAIKAEEMKIHDECVKIREPMKTYLASEESSRTPELTTLFENQINMTDEHLCAEFMASDNFDDLGNSALSDTGLQLATDEKTQSTNFWIAISLGTASVGGLAVGLYGVMKWREAVKEQDLAKQRIADAESNEKLLIQETENQTRNVQELTSELEDTKTRIQAMTTQIEADAAKLNQLNSQIEALKNSGDKNLTENVKKLEELNKSLNETTNSLNASKSRLADFQGRLTNRTAELEKQKLNLQQFQDANVKSEEKIKNHKERIQRAEEFNKKRDKLYADIKEKEAALDQKRNRRYDWEIYRLSNDVNKQKGTLEKLEKNKLEAERAKAAVLPEKDLKILKEKIDLSNEKIFQGINWKPQQAPFIAGQKNPGLEHFENLTKNMPADTPKANFGKLTAAQRYECYLRSLNWAFETKTRLLPPAEQNAFRQSINYKMNSPEFGKFEDVINGKEYTRSYLAQADEEPIKNLEERLAKNEANIRKVERGQFIPKQIEDLKKEIETSGNKLKDLQNKANLRPREIEKLQAEIQNLRRQTLNAGPISSPADIQNLKNDLVVLEKSREETTKQILAAEKSIKELEELTKRYNLDIEDSTKKISLNETDRVRIQNQIGELDSEITKRKSELTKLNGELVDKQKSKDSLTAKISEQNASLVEERNLQASKQSELGEKQKVLKDKMNSQADLKAKSGLKTSKGKMKSIRNAKAFTAVGVGGVILLGGAGVAAALAPQMKLASESSLPTLKMTLIEAVENIRKSRTAIDQYWETLE